MLVTAPAVERRAARFRGLAGRDTAPGQGGGTGVAAGDYSGYMYGLVDRAVSSIGPREACSEAEKELGRLFAAEVERACSGVEFEDFTCSPKAFMGLFPFLVFAYAVGLVFYFMYPAVSFGLAAVGLAALLLEVVRYREFADFLFPRREGQNVAGVIPPSGDIEQRLIVCAHLDSAYEFKIWYWFKSLAVPVMVAALLSVAVLMGASLARLIAGESGLPGALAFKVIGIALIATAPFVVVMAFWHTSDVVPGAVDNMSGVAVLAGLARYLEEASGNGEFHPRKTEVVLLACSSEEAGLRGAKRYAARHKSEFEDVPTRALIIDSVHDERFLTVFKRELWPGAKHDPGMVALVRDSARAAGYEPKVAIMPLGASDAAAFTLAGIPSTFVCCMDSSRIVPHYHTRLDTVDLIRPQSLACALALTIETLKRIDGS